MSDVNLLLLVCLVVWTAATVTTTGALLILYLCLGGFFVGMLAISKKIRNDGNTVRVVDVAFAVTDLSVWAEGGILDNLSGQEGRSS